MCAHLHPSRRPFCGTLAEPAQDQQRSWQCHTLQLAKGAKTAASCRCKLFCWHSRGNQDCRQFGCLDRPQTGVFDLWGTWYRPRAPPRCFLPCSVLSGSRPALWSLSKSNSSIAGCLLCVKLDFSLTGLLLLEHLGHPLLLSTLPDILACQL